jgi:hypothetical protein
MKNPIDHIQKQIGIQAGFVFTIQHHIDILQSCILMNDLTDMKCHLEEASAVFEICFVKGLDPILVRATYTNALVQVCKGMDGIRFKRYTPQDILIHVRARLHKEVLLAKTLQDTTSLDILTELYQDYCVKNGLPPVAAEEQDRANCTEQQWLWIQVFITLWNKTIDTY